MEAFTEAYQYLLEQLREDLNSMKIIGTKKQKEALSYTLWQLASLATHPAINPQLDQLACFGEDEQEEERSALLPPPPLVGPELEGEDTKEMKKPAPARVDSDEKIQPALPISGAGVGSAKQPPPPKAPEQPQEEEEKEEAKEEPVRRHSLRERHPFTDAINDLDARGKLGHHYFLAWYCEAGETQKVAKEQRGSIRTHGFHQEGSLYNAQGVVQVNEKYNAVVVASHSASLIRGMRDVYARDPPPNCFTNKVALGIRRPYIWTWRILDEKRIYRPQDNAAASSADAAVDAAADDK